LESDGSDFPRELPSGSDCFDFPILEWGEGRLAVNVVAAAPQVPIAARFLWARAKVSLFDSVEWRIFDVVARWAVTFEQLRVRAFLLAHESDPGGTMQSPDQPFRRLQ
jgi:hypothetical protein